MVRGTLLIVLLIAAIYLNSAHVYLALLGVWLTSYIGDRLAELREAADRDAYNFQTRLTEIEGQLNSLPFDLTERLEMIRSDINSLRPPYRND